ncbi:MAG: sigma-70 family RNA polymerase sigma factor [Clostridiaceae bacterium]|nr:sigma-70 family RNA polymerase sigma factor [Clostridiaceae bacterium]
MEQQALRTDDCIEKVIRYYSDMVYRLAFAHTGTKHDADDVFQEVFLRYVKKKPVFEDEEHRKAWLIRVTINCSNNFWSSLWKKKRQELTDELLFETEETKNLYVELQELPSKYREVIHLFYYENMSLEEISLTLNRKNSTVRTQLTRARAMLKKFMKEEDYV